MKKTIKWLTVALAVVLLLAGAFTRLESNSAVSSTPVLSSITNVSEGIEIQWDAVPNAQLYRVFRQNDSGAWEPIVDTTATGYVDRTAEPGNEYTYTVRCMDRTGKTYTSDYDESGISAQCVPVAAPSREEKTGTIRIAVAFGGENSESAEEIVSMLTSYGAEAEIVTTDADVSEYDGLVLPGGGDIDPSRYGEKNTDSTGIDRYLDDVQFTLADRFIQAKKPVLGICRGGQVLNVYFGGTLNQDISGHKDRSQHTTITAGSILSSLYGSSLDVYSFHHQSAKDIGSDLNIIMRSDDGTVEGFEHAYLPVIGLQWHPEYMDSTGGKIFEYFIQMCRYTY